MTIPAENSTTLIAMPHQYTDGDETYDFVDSGGADDGPYVADGGVVVAAADVSVSGVGMETTDETTMDGPEMEDTTAEEGGSPGFGIVVAVLALLGRPSCRVGTEEVLAPEAPLRSI